MWLFDKEIERQLKEKGLSSYADYTNDKADNRRLKIFGSILLLVLILLFIPWTQNIQSNGLVTTLRPEQRPQELNTLIAGKIDKWFVKEGDVVRKGDTILKISEIKSEYLDPRLIERTHDQIVAKESANAFYENKAGSLDKQIRALSDSRALKIEQLKNKIIQTGLYIKSDSIALVAAENEYKITYEQYQRQVELHKEGLRSLTDLEQRSQTYQNALAKRNITENKFYNTKNELINLEIELSAIEREYAEKMSKAESDKFQSYSQISSGIAEISKLENIYNSYIIRNGFYYIIAPQDGQITKTIKAGIGETVKEGELVVRIAPKDFELAVELYVTPNDLPLVRKDQEVRLQFDGWPAIVFSGWPKATYGTFSGKVTSVDNFISDNGKFRILIKQSSAQSPWPVSLKIGGGARGIALLNDVPIWYEAWRKLNGFPPDFYSPTKDKKEKP